MTTQRAPTFVLDPRARAMLAEMGVRVWMPAEVAKPLPLQAKQDVAFQPSTRTETAPGDAPAALPRAVAIPVRREPPLRLPVMDAPPASAPAGASAFAVTRYVIANMPEDTSPYDLVVLGEPCQGAAEQLLGHILKLLAPAAPRIWRAHMVASHNEATYLHDQLASLPAKLVLALGPHAATALLDQAAQGVPFSQLRGTVHQSQCVVTYHPQQLLRQPKAKAQAWLDIKLAIRTLQASPPSTAQPAKKEDPT